METKDFLREITEIMGVSGYELKVGLKINDYFHRLCDQTKIDKLGNVIGYKKGSGNGPKIMLAAHMDEIGLMITKIEEGGFLRFTSVGGIDPRTLPAQEVTIYGKEKVYGIIGAKPPHLTEPEERTKAIKMYDLFIDTGLSEEEVKEKIGVGDIVVVNRKLLELKNNYVSGKALDDRAGVAVIIECLKELRKMVHTADVYAVATVQEEVGLRGAMVSSYGIVPDIGIAIDVCFGDMPGLSEEYTSKLDDGPVLAIGPNIHPKVFEGLKKVADNWNIPIQLETAPGHSGTDAGAIQIARGGIATAVVSLPQRYMHTSVETLAIQDIKKAGKLLALYIASLDKKGLEELKCY
ncbi:endoglucanase [Anaerobranca californiensis DSM 14826]|uniref:Endoglucanase n=1 Tax=Anaerobranca californiensis DSM 14826 TaxID=1120989 RepID=A0A1M6KL00_9FIRM|nr:M42 family metallopeptidase [Anaerobranca californiensis]SHJ59609.1 endoglucanase [Anaerobranca californiensis DSM 14826]